MTSPKTNKQNQIPRHFRERIQAAKDNKLKELDLSSLFSKDNEKLTEIPTEVLELEQLEVLNLKFNQLTRIPESISKLTNLIELNLSGNQLKSIPKSISRLTNLTKLYLRYNELKTIPESIGKLTNLKAFYLRDNQLMAIPESIGKLTSLKELYLSNNQLMTIPESIGKLTNLEELYLSNNQLKIIPVSINQLTNLSRLYLSGNPLETPPIEIVEKGIEAIREYLRQIEEEGIDYLYEAKLLIIGEGGAGKTTLANKIQNSDYELQDEDTTKGIEVHQWDFQTANKNDFQMNIWDFGGQEIYHATHQFFLTKRSLYILVADTRKEDTDFYYWLNVAELLSDNSPLLIVKNEKQDRKREINQRALQGQFSNIKEILATNLADNRGLKEIRKNIQYYISNLPHIGSALPKTWKKVREVLETDGRNYISLEEYLSICEKNLFKKREDKLLLSGYLHDLGVFLHFQDDPLLNKTVILKPEWGTAAVYKALDNPQVYENFGRFTKDDLTNIWHEDQYANMQDELLQLMIKFKLCYKIPGTSQTYIAPQLLTGNQPEYDWDESNNLILRYTYEFMPKGIITQFIVAMHKEIEKQKYVWKSGVILKKNQTRAEVIEYYSKREIKIRISGQQKRDLMTILTDKLDEIHSSYNNRLKYNQLIPCNCGTCKNNQNPYFYNFTELKERISNQKYTIECGKPPYHQVNILRLIDDVIEKDRSRDLLEFNDNYFRAINSPQPKVDKPKKFGFSDFLTWGQNGQFIFNLGTAISAIIGIILLIIHPILFPNGLPEWVKPIQDIIPAPQKENESDG
ncbi:MAG: GTPase [Okeania sp. SIO2C2]|uniref:COR domain-containing protein n=1 Tax=Okeania sp. SIO2C2 TaxID=2607787 RepID=UPI0013B75210|nr:COR domain-containing protein [Okeania sp. SIO2C2]NEP88726.1 GTPase [Okeania sp. SIO2C2]